jgi:ABC-type multidrug transport system ATPase subunit
MGELEVLKDESTPAIWKCENMGAGYSEAEGILKNINLEVKAGERVALLGRPNGGRFLLLRALAGLRPVRQGEITVFGNKLERLPYWADWDEIMPQALRRRMGVCLEVEGLLSNVSVREGLELLFRFKYGAHNQKLRDAAAKIVVNICLKFGLDQAIDKRPFTLTPAEKRLSGLARAFLSKPHVVVLENPSQSIGDLNRELLWQGLAIICDKSERTVLISTDDWAIATQFCSRWIVLEGGMVTFDGKPKDFLEGQHELIENLKRLTAMQSSYESLLKKAMQHEAGGGVVI